MDISIGFDYQNAIDLLLIRRAHEDAAIQSCQLWSRE